MSQGCLRTIMRRIGLLASFAGLFYAICQTIPQVFTKGFALIASAVWG